MKEKGIRFVGESLGRPAAAQKEKEESFHKEMTTHNANETKLGQEKKPMRWRRSGQYCGYIRSWGMTIYMVMNLMKLVQNQVSFSSLDFWYCCASCLNPSKALTTMRRGKRASDWCIFPCATPFKFVRQKRLIQQALLIQYSSYIPYSCGGILCNLPQTGLYW